MSLVTYEVLKEEARPKASTADLLVDAGACDVEMRPFRVLRLLRVISSWGFLQEALEEGSGRGCIGIARLTTIVEVRRISLDALLVLLHYRHTPEGLISVLSCLK